jgi:hypothetical protein
MKDIGLMHYFLGIEFWQEDRHFFRGQGKYVEDIMSIFQIEYCRPMSTPMVTSWRNLSASEFKLVDATRYRQLVVSLIYLANTIAYIFFCYEHSQSVYGGA